ncbi:myomegalin-like [Bufo bufo]|uniref:myomegalin-like n=1 Tax=Bufo bufo TaxID=8384 RepID=UPI001ABE96DC|nr:myomegalin-like [Bufo bufo]
MTPKEYKDVLHYQPNLERVQGGIEHMIQKLQQRIKERDAALEKAVDDKFCALEEKEKDIQRLRMIIREREHDLERLSNVLSGNEETINSLDSLVKAKDMELDQISAAYKNLQWLKEETEEKYRCSLIERESIILQLQKNLQERNKEMEEIRTNFLGKFDICSGHMIEELKMSLQRKEKMLQDAVFARNQQAEEHMKEVMDLLAMVSSEKMDQTSSCQNCLLKEHNTGVNQYVGNLSNFIHLQKLVQEKEKIIQTLTQSCSVQPMVISMKSEDLDAKGEETEKNKTLKSDLAKAKEDLRLVLRKMREYQLEVSVLQSIIMKQNEQLREQATDIDTLTRKNLMKEELIKDLQVKLADPEEIPTVELLTQQIFTLKENMATLNLASHGHLTHTQKVLACFQVPVSPVQSVLWCSVFGSSMSRASDIDDSLSVPETFVSGQAGPSSLRNWTIPKLLAELNKRGIPHPASARKAELSKLLMTGPNPSRDQPGTSSIQLSLVRLQSTMNTLVDSVADVQARVTELKSWASLAPPALGPLATASTSICLTPGTPSSIPQVAPSHFIPENLKRDILAGKDVNLASVLIAAQDGPENRVINCGDVSVVLRAKLSIPEFVLAFSLFRDIVCTAQPERREELDTYLYLVTDLGHKYGGSAFYDYH